VEAAFLFAVARQWDAVELMRNKADIYCQFGSGVLGRPITKEHDGLLRNVFKESVLACGFGMGLAKFEARLESKGIDVSSDVRTRAHAGYRQRFPRVPDLWKGLESAAQDAIRYPGRTFSYNDIHYTSDGYWLICTLPSGRGFYYPNARLSTGKFGNDEIIYEGWVRIDGRPAGWGDVRTWGGTLTENICQAGCRDLMVEDELEVEALPGWNMTMTVYDELVAEFPDTLAPGEGIKTLLGIMGRPPHWLPQMPVRAEGFEALRYRKD
jgi:DNA polymerase